MRNNAMERYKIGHRMPFREKDVHVANAEIVRRFVSDAGEQMIEARIIEIAPSYSGTLRPGTMVTFPEEGFEGVYQKP
jgi:hypothetical protein